MFCNSHGITINDSLIFHVARDQIIADNLTIYQSRGSENSTVMSQVSNSTSTSSSAGLRILSLDGGGIRGLSTLLIVQMIMYRIMVKEGLEETPRPCDYFDLIGGTSTGGIIALMLGRLRMSVEKAIEWYDELAGKVFREVGIGANEGVRRTSSLEAVIKEIVQSKTDDRETDLLDNGCLGGVCKTFVCALNAHNMNTPALFRTYISPKEPPIACTIWQAARATSASPMFFDPVKIGPDSRPEPYVDGGMGLNNPTAQVLAEADAIFPGRSIACVISIGAGKLRPIDVRELSSSKEDDDSIPPVFKALGKIATDCEKTAEEMEKKFANSPTRTYFRFNVEQGLQLVKHEDWDRMNEVSAHTSNYMKGHEVDSRLDSAVEIIRGVTAMVQSWGSPLPSHMEVEQ